MPRSGILTVLVAECTFSPGSPLFANSAQAQAGSQTYTRARVVTNRFVTGIIFDSTIWDLIDARIDENVSLVQDWQSRIVPGLADPSAISFESVNFPGRYLHYPNNEIWLDANNGSALFRSDAAFGEQ